MNDEQPIGGEGLPGSVYTARVIGTIAHGEGAWNSLRVGIYHREEGSEERQVGTYVRNYHRLYNTFHVFVRQGRELALYSPNYATTRIMRLPDCVDIGGEESTANGFCPVDLYVPRRATDNDLDEDDNTIAVSSDLGFVAGCVWGDDTTWKIQRLDLTHATDGVIVREELYGYLVLPQGYTLARAVRLNAHEGRVYGVTILAEHRFATNGNYQWH